MTINSKIKVNSIEAFDPVGPVQISYGATVSPGSTFQINGNANFSSGIVTASNHSGVNVNVSSGIMTAGFFVGSASSFTNLPVISSSKSIAFTLIG